MAPSAVQTSDHVAARAKVGELPAAENLFGDRGNDADWFRIASERNGILPCIPLQSSRKMLIPHDKTIHKRRRKMENAFARLKDWLKLATGYDRCPLIYLSAWVLAAIVIFRLCVLTQVEYLKEASWTHRTGKDVRDQPDHRLKNNPPLHAISVSRSRIA